MQRRLSCIAALGLITLLTLGGAAPVGAATPIVVSPANMHGWAFVNDNSAGPATGMLVDGPGTPPLGTGSANLPVTGVADGQILATQTYAGTLLSAITNFQYSTYISSPTSPPSLFDIALQFDVDYDSTDANTSYQGRLVFEPFTAGTVTSGIWQTWNPLTSGKWFASRLPQSTSCSQAVPCSWAQVKTNWPTAGILTGSGVVDFKAGSGWTAFNGNVDAFTIGVSGTDTTYDFEAIDPGTLTTGTTLSEPAGTTLTGAIVTGADVHAVQVCAYVATPTGTTAGTNTAGTLNDFSHKAQSYNGSGSVSITPLTLNFASGSVLLLATYDLTPTAAGAASNAPAPEQACPAGTATFGPEITGKTLPAVTGLTDVVRTLLPDTSTTMTLLDVRYIVVA